MSIATAPAPSARPQDAALARQQDGLVMENGRYRLLIEEWLPIKEVSIESLRERTPMTPFPAPNRLHVWFARRPLVASRAAILCSLLPVSKDPAQLEADKKTVIHMLGIHGDPVASRRRIDDAKRDGQRFEGEAYTYRRAFTYTPTDEEIDWSKNLASTANLNGRVLLDPTAGGGAIPFEGLRLGAEVVANDLNPVSWLLLKATVEYPRKLGAKLHARFVDLAEKFVKRRDERLQFLFPEEPKPNCHATNWLWARAIRCPYCGGKVPLSPNWKLDSDGMGVKIVTHTENPDNRHCTFEVVSKAKDHSPGTVKGGNATCPFPDCQRYIDGDEIKAQAQKGEMGHQLYAVIFKEEVYLGMTKGKNPRAKTKSVRSFRAPRPEDDNVARVEAALASKMPEWTAADIVPSEAIDPVSNYDRGHRLYGVYQWSKMFSPRQLYGHCVATEVFHELWDELLIDHQGDVPEEDRAAMVYLVAAINKVVNYNSISSRYDVVREAVRGTFDRHNFAFQWSYGEVAATTAGIGYDWAVEQTGKALEELIELAGGEQEPNLISGLGVTTTPVTVFNEPAQSLAQAEESVDCIVMDPPYYDNVMYAELSDFFYVWIKRTAGKLYPEMLAKYPALTDKENEAVANPAHFKGQKGARELAGRDYEDRMACIFERCRQMLKPTGVMTVMFTHKSSAAWDALASGIVRAGFVITASWPVNTEAEGSLHIKQKSAAKSTIFLVCRPRVVVADSDSVYWEDVEPKVVEKVRERVGEFQAAGITGVDLYLACFGPALQVFSEYWPLKRGRAVQAANGKAGRNGRAKAAAASPPTDPYAVRPEDALEAARREVKRWRMETLATVKRKHHLDPLTEWYVLAWDTFKAPRFSADEALRLARVVGLDFDREVKNVVCEVKGDDVALWDSKARQSKGKLGPVGDAVMLDTLHHTALVGREQNTGAALALVQEAKLADDPTLLTTLEVLLNVLPPPAAARRVKKADPLLAGSASDFEALEKLRQLAFDEVVPRSVQLDIPFKEAAAEGAEDGEDADELEPEGDDEASE